MKNSANFDQLSKMVSIQAQNFGYKRKEEHLVDAFKTIDRIYKTLNEM